MSGERLVCRTHGGDPGAKLGVGVRSGSLLRAKTGERCLTPKPVTDTDGTCVISVDPSREIADLRRWTQHGEMSRWKETS